MRTDLSNTAPPMFVVVRVCVLQQNGLIQYYQRSMAPLRSLLVHLEIGLTLALVFASASSQQVDPTDSSILVTIENIVVVYPNDYVDIRITLSSLIGRPFIDIYNTLYYSFVEYDLLDGDCFANKLTFSNGTVSFTPQYKGLCRTALFDETISRFTMNFDPRDFLRFINMGLATAPYPNFMVFTNTDPFIGSIPIQPILQERPLIATTNTINSRGIFTFLFDYYMGDGIFIFHFASFIRLTSMDLQQITLRETRDSGPVFTLTGGTILNSGKLGLSVAFLLTESDRESMGGSGICTNSENCYITSTPTLGNGYTGAAIESISNRKVGRFFSQPELEPVYLEVTAEYIGYTKQIPLEFGQVFQPGDYDPYQELITRVACITDGNSYINPELYINEILVDERYVTRNWPREVVITTDQGIVAENLLGYYTCKTQNDTFITSHVIHTGFYFYFIGGRDVQVDYNRTKTFQIIVTPNFVPFSIGDGHNPVPFEYTITTNETFQSLFEIKISNLQFSDSGRYNLISIGHIPFTGFFTVTVNPPTLTVIPAVLTFFPAETRANLTCTTSHPEIGTVWQHNGSNLTSIIYSETNTFELIISPDNQLDGQTYVCVVFNPESFEADIFNQVDVTIRQVNEPLTLIGFKSGRQIKLKNEEFVPNVAYFECLGHSPSGTTGLYWTIVDRKAKTQEDIFNDMNKNNFVATAENTFLSLNILGEFSGIITCKSQTAGQEIGIDIFTVELTNGRDYIQFLDLSTEYSGRLSSTDDGCSNIIYTDYGIPFGTRTQNYVYVCANGLITVGSPPLRLAAESAQLPTSNLRVFQTNLLAPYWNDHDIRTEDSSVYYKMYTLDNSKTELQYVSGFVSNQKSVKFDGVWMIVVSWVNAPRFHYLADFSARNSFEAILVTDGLTSYAIYTYECGSLGWGQSQNFVNSIIGYNINPEAAIFNDVPSFINHPFSGLNNVNDIACSNIPIGTRWTNLIYKVGVSRDTTQLSRTICLQQTKNDTVLSSVNSNILTTCPCSSTQAFWDITYVIINMASLTRDQVYLAHWCFGKRFARVDMYRSICCYRRNDGALTNFNGITTLVNFNPITQGQDFVEYDHNLRRQCILGGALNQYRIARPPLSCTEYRPPRRTWALGDPHFTSLDGVSFTFNGWGEYLLMQISNGTLQFEMQARTKPVNGSTATQFTGFAFAMARRLPIEVRLSPSMELEVYVNGTEYTIELVNNNCTTTTDFFFISCSNSRSVIVTFPNEIGVAVNASTSGMLSFTLIVPDQFHNFTRGLLGNYNKQKGDDIMFRNGTVLTGNVTDRQIHEFGQSWQLVEKESLFTYPDGQSYIDYANYDHIPAFLDEVVATASTEVLAACDNSAECIYDARETGNIDVGLDTLTTNAINIDIAAQTSNFPPFISGPSILNIVLGQETVLVFNATDDKNSAEVTVVGGLPDGASLESMAMNEYTQYTFRWRLFEISNPSLVFAATDDHNATSILEIQVVICACQNQGTCTLDGLLSTNDDTIVMNCICPPGWEGIYCDRDVDGCADFVCFDETNCTDIPAPGVGAMCGPCPNGYQEDGAKCADIDECSTNNHNCTDLCENLPGSFRCACRPGFQLISTTDCEDINECSLLNGGCHQICVNLEGNFACNCSEGYYLTNDNRTCEADPTANCSVSNPCNQTCLRLAGTEFCDCRLGYQLATDRMSCTAINECDQNPCEQICIDTDEGYRCGCEEGYTLLDDGRCEDVNECFEAALTTILPVDELAICGSSMSCVNTEGSYECICPQGTELMREQLQCIKIVFTTAIPTTSAETTAESDTTSTLETTAESDTTSALETTADSDTTSTLETTAESDTTSTLDVEFPATISNQFISDAVIVKLLGETLESFTIEKQLQFRMATADAINTYCESNDCPISSRSTITKRNAVTASDVFITNIGSDGTPNTVQFYVYALKDGGVLSGTVLLIAIEVMSYQTFVVATVALVVPVEPSVPPALTLAQIIGIAVGCSLGLSLLAIVLFTVCVCCCVSSRKKSYEVKPSTGIEFKNPAADEEAGTAIEQEGMKAELHITTPQKGQIKPGHKWVATEDHYNTLTEEGENEYCSSVTVTFQ